MREKAEDPEPVIDGDDDDALPGERLAVIGGARSRSDPVAPSVNEDEDRPLSVRRRPVRPDVERQAVFVDRELGAGGRLFRPPFVRGRCRLHGVVAERVRLA